MVAGWTTCVLLEKTKKIFFLGGFKTQASTGPSWNVYSAYSDGADSLPFDMNDAC